jgi:putative ABC transport system permease protein
LSDATPATVFIPIAQVEDQVMRTARQFVTMKFAIRTTGDPLSLSAAVRQAMAGLDSSLPLARMRSLEQIVARSLAADRFNTTLLGLFALIGLALATVGIYGVISYTAEQRTHEIGLRLALGAQTRDVVWMVIRQGLGLAGIGVAIGIAAAFALGRLLTSFSGLLYGVTVTDPVTFSLISALLLLVALVACYLPARRATKVEPLIALREC